MPVLRPNGSPRLGQSSPLATRLFSYVNAGDAAGINAVGWKAGTNNGLTANIDPYIGKVLVGDLTAAHSVTFSGFPATHLTKYTLACIFKVISDQNIQVLMLTSGAGGGVGLSIGIQAGLGVLLARGVAFAGPVLTRTAGVPYFVIVSGNETANTAAYVQKRMDTGDIVGAGTFGSLGTSTASNGTFTLGNADAAATASGNSDIAAALVTNTFVTLDVLLGIARDPWALWYPAIPDMFVGIVAGDTLMGAAWM